MMSNRRPAFSLIRLMPVIPGGSRLAGWLLGVLALLLVLTQQGGQAHALAHGLSSARSALAEQLAAAQFDQQLDPRAPRGGVSAATPPDARTGPSGERDAVDALCVLCVGFANTLATAAVSLPGALPLLVLGEFRPLSRRLGRQSLLRVGHPIRGPPAAFSFLR